MKTEEFKFRVFDAKKKEWIGQENIARLHFNGGKCYAVLTWDERMLLGNDFVLEILSREK